MCVRRRTSQVRLSGRPASGPAASQPHFRSPKADSSLPWNAYLVPRTQFCLFMVISDPHRRTPIIVPAIYAGPVRIRGADLGTHGPQETQSRCSWTNPNSTLSLPPYQHMTSAPRLCNCRVSSEGVRSDRKEPLLSSPPPATTPLSTFRLMALYRSKSCSLGA